MPSKKTRQRKRASSAVRPKVGRERAKVKGVAPAAPSASDVFPIVGIGASAGGLEAVTQFLKNLPERPGMAFVLVQHLDPTHESALTSLLSRITAMNVTEARNNTRLEPNRMYVIPPNRFIRVSGHCLRVSPRGDTKDMHMPIDQFLESLAEEAGGRSIGVILSGNNSDGTRGLLAVKAAGGITFAQDDKTAKYPAMPASAVAAGCVDLVLPPDRIAQELASIAKRPCMRPDRVQEAEQVPAGADKLYDEIFAILRRRVGVDFKLYKPATIHRRVQHRIAMRKFESLQEYLGYLRSHATEADELFNDILIHVTSFFRDRSVFQILRKKVYPRLIKNRSPEAPIRIWVPGCSTGEEAYSIAIGLTEYLADMRVQFPIQVFGTDIHSAALEKARAGLFSAGISADMPGERLRRFFVKIDAGYRISKSIRDLCIFARQNVAVDPPFSSLDLISCRNVLIYLGLPLQRKVFPMLHYALKPGGFLLLGASETTGAFSEFFTLLDKKGRIYTKKAVHSRMPLTFAHAFTEPKVEQPQPSPAIVTQEQFSPAISEVQKQADRLVLAQYCPAGVVINRRLEVLQFRGRTGPYLEHASGEASLNLLKMAREGLVGDLRAAVAKAVKRNTRVRMEAVRSKQDHGFLTANLEVIPFRVPPSQEDFFLVTFEPVGGPAEPKPNRIQGRVMKARGGQETEDAETVSLRDELSATRESLQAIIEEQEATNEQLRSANEEITSSNEELQSTNEEMETAKEELQSTNEELNTLNDELESRNMELEQVNNDLQNLMASVNLPIIMIGRDLRIRRFTSVAEKAMNLIPADVGRPITDINLSIDAPDLDKQITEVIDTLQTRELEARCRKGHWWSVRIRPYKTSDNKIDGAVIAMVDIDLLKEGADRAARAREFTQMLLNTVGQPLLVLDQDLVVQSVNDAVCHLFQVSAEEMVSRPLDRSGDGRWNVPALRSLLADVLAHEGARGDLELDQEFPHMGRKRLLFRARHVQAPEAEREAVLVAIEEAAEG